jgi:hypothetical protein
VTRDEAFELDACPECGDRLMKVKKTGLVACLNNLEFKDCRWHVRFTPDYNKKKKDGK